jgi:sugar/nucleoside kinase (ribokinase family)
LSEILVVGSVALDTIHTPAGSHESLLGGSASYFSLAASFYVPVRVVAVVGDDFLAEHREILSKRRIDLTGLQVAEGETFRWEGVYTADMNERTTVRTELNVFESFHPVLPTSYQQSQSVLLANIDPLLQEEVLDQLDAPSLVALDTMNYWITNRREELLRVLRRVNLFLLNDSEARELTGAENIQKAAEGIQMMGPSIVVIKRGEYGALACTDGGWFSLPSYPIETLKDPTGAGDAFAGGMIGYLSRRGSIDEASIRTGMAHGTAVASLAVEEFGVDGLLQVTEEQLQERVRTLATMTKFDPE